MGLLRWIVGGTVKKIVEEYNYVDDFKCRKIVRDMLNAYNPPSGDGLTEADVLVIVNNVVAELNFVNMTTLEEELNELDLKILHEDDIIQLIKDNMPPVGPGGVDEQWIKNYVSTQLSLELGKINNWTADDIHNIVENVFGAADCVTTSTLDTELDNLWADAAQEFISSDTFNEEVDGLRLDIRTDEEIVGIADDTVTAAIAQLKAELPALIKDVIKSWHDDDDCGDFVRRRHVKRDCLER